MEQLTKKERKSLLRRLTPVVAAKLRFLKDTQYDYKEISELSGVPQNRMSALVKERVPINELTLVALLGGGMITTEEILKKGDMSQRERLWVESKIIFENKELRRLLFEIVKNGDNPVEIIEQGLKKKV